MRPVAILTDSSSDLSPKYQDEYGIRLIKAHIRIPGNDDAEAFVTWEEGGTDRDLFYADLKKRPEAYATSPPNVEGPRGTGLSGLRRRRDHDLFGDQRLLRLFDDRRRRGDRGSSRGRDRLRRHPEVRPLHRSHGDIHCKVARRGKELPRDNLLA